MTFWSSEKIIEATGGRLIGSEFSFDTLTTDSRALQQGEFFVALSGENFNGHDYIAKAQQQGAIGALVSQKIDTDLPQILVADTLEALQDMARYRRKHYHGQVVGITGSVGKTSAKEMLKLALSEYGEAYATAGNYNNHIGLPITLCNLPESADYAIIEMGMNHAGEISFLSKITKPQVALITTIAAVHLEFFESVEGIAHAKAEIFDGMEGGVAVLPADNEYVELLMEKHLSQWERSESPQGDTGECPLPKSKISTSPSGRGILTFGKAPTSDLQLLSSDATYRYQNQTRHFTLQTRGSHWPVTALGVLGCIIALELPLEKAEKALANYQEQEGRGAVLTLPWQGGEITLMDDAYNASPVSMKAAIETLASLAEGRKLAILGEMLELGASSAALHQALTDPIKEQPIDGVITIGKAMEPLANILPQKIHLAHFENAKSAIRSIETLVKPNDIVLCKGSHGSGVYQLVEALKQHS